jgi:hypothetical protein
VRLAVVASDAEHPAVFEVGVAAKRRDARGGADAGKRAALKELIDNEVLYATLLNRVMPEFKQLETMRDELLGNERRWKERDEKAEEMYKEWIKTRELYPLYPGTGPNL